MISKFLRPTYRYSKKLLAIRRIPQKITFVRYTDLVPPSQYDIPFPKRMHFGYLIKTYWETIPLLCVTLCAILGVAFNFIWASQNKVDVVFTTRSRRNISRTMDLRHPTVHKLIIINQVYEPWPEMQDVLDKMKVAERRALLRAQTCSLQQQSN